MTIIQIDNNNIGLLNQFIIQIGTASKKFRYYNNRSIEVVKNHLLTILLMEKDRPIAYGHLDKENEIVWLGICVLPDFQGKGYSKILMNELISFSMKNKIRQIYLSVDIDNINAIHLYEYYNFTILEKTDSHLKYVLNIK